MTYSAYSTVTISAQPSQERPQRQASGQKAANRKATSSRATKAKTSSSSVESYSSYNAYTQPSSSRPQYLTSSSQPTSSMSRTRSQPDPRLANQKLSRLQFDEEKPELEPSSGYSSSETETEHEIPLSSRRNYGSHDSYFSHSYNTRANFIHPSAYPIKQEPIMSPLVAERSFGPDMGFGERAQWYEAEDLDGHAAWTAYAPSENRAGRGRAGSKNMGCIVEECRW